VNHYENLFFAETVSNSNEITPRIRNRLTVREPITLQILFEVAEKLRARRLSTQMMDKEERLMQAWADAEEDSDPDDGAIEIDSGEVGR
jgi:hypothetical protein